MYHHENTQLSLVQKHLNFIYKLWTITAVHCKYIVSDKPTPSTMHQVPTLGTNECIAMGSTQVQGRLSRTVVNLIKVIIHPTVDLSPGHASIPRHQALVYIIMCCV